MGVSCTLANSLGGSLPDCVMFDSLTLVSVIGAEAIKKNYTSCNVSSSGCSCRWMMENKGKQETYSREDRHASNDSQKFLFAARARLPYWAICLRLGRLAHFVCAAKGGERKEVARGIQQKLPCSLFASSIN